MATALGPLKSSNSQLKESRAHHFPSIEISFYYTGLLKIFSKIKENNFSKTTKDKYRNVLPLFLITKFSEQPPSRFP